MERVLSEVCAAEIVLLGESGHHGDGGAQGFKADLLDRMLDDCPPELIAFEASTYEFERLDPAYAIRRTLRSEILEGQTVSASQIATALGRKWNRNAETRPVAERVAQANGEGVRVIGLDDQLGAVGQDYSNKELVLELTQELEPDMRAQCRDVLRRRIRFEYSADHPRDARERERVQICADLIENASRSRAARPFVRFLRRDALPRDKRSADRDASMSETFQSEYRGGRAVIWAATVHAAKRDNRLGGHVAKAYDRTFALGFSAQSGAYRRMDGAVMQRPELPTGAIEALGPGYLDRVALKAAGERPGAVFGPVQTRDWSDVLDGVVVFKTERPTELVP